MWYGMRWDGIKWSGVVINEILFFGFANNGWNKMEHDGIHFIQFHPNVYFLFHPIWGVCDGIRYF